MDTRALVVAAFLAGCEGAPAAAEETSDGTSGTSGLDEVPGSETDSSTSRGPAPETSSTSSTSEAPGTSSTGGSESSGEPPVETTGPPIEVPTRILWFLASTHGAEGVWPPASEGGVVQLESSPTYAALAQLDVPITFVTGVDNAIVDGDVEPHNADAMTRLLTAALVVDGVATGPSIDVAIGETLDRVPLMGATYYAGIGRASNQPAAYWAAGNPRAPLGDPSSTWESYVSVAGDGEGFPAPPALDYDPDDGAQIPVLLDFHAAMAAGVLARGLNAHAILQLGAIEAFYRPQWLGTDCTAQDLYHAVGDCGPVTWQQLLTWSTAAAIEVTHAVDAHNAEDGTSLLDHTLIVWMQDYGTAGPHSLADLPVVLIGGAALGFEGVRLVDAEGHDQADLAVTLAALAGTPVESFGHPSHAAAVIDALLPE